MANWWDNAPVSGGDRNAGQWWAAAPLVQQKTFERNEDEQLYRHMLRENLGKNRPLMDIGSEGLRQHTDEEIRNITIERVQSQRAREAEEKAFRKSRTPLRRASETADFILSAPVRALTKGKYGIADVYGLFDPEAGAEARQQEANFVRANQGWLEPVATAGGGGSGWHRRARQAWGFLSWGAWVLFQDKCCDRCAVLSRKRCLGKPQGPLFLPPPRHKLMVRQSASLIARRSRPRVSLSSLQPLPQRGRHASHVPSKKPPWLAALCECRRTKWKWRWAPASKPLST